MSASRVYLPTRILDLPIKVSWVGAPVSLTLSLHSAGCQGYFIDSMTLHPWSSTSIETDLLLDPATAGIYFRGNNLVTHCDGSRQKRLKVVWSAFCADPKMAWQMAPAALYAQNLLKRAGTQFTRSGR